MIGGSALAELGLEARVPLVLVGQVPIGAALFVDAADVTERAAALGGLHWAAGCGLRVGSPVGAVRLEAGIRLNRRDQLAPVERLAFHLMIGEQF